MHLQTLVSPTNPNVFSFSSSGGNKYLMNHSFVFLPPTNPYVKFLSTSKSNNGFCCFTTRRVFECPIILKNHDVNYGSWVESKQVQAHIFYMRRCVELAKKGIGHTSPDPMVGCVLVKDDVIVGEGFYPRAGATHAEVSALREAGKLARGSTAYINIDPCNGGDAPCTTELLLAGVKKVVVGMKDPNPVVGLKGGEQLNDYEFNGLVLVGREEKLCLSLNEAYIHRKLSGKPFFTLRFSVSVNGRILDQLGEEAKECGGYYSQLLQEYDAVIFSNASLKEKSSFPSSKEPGAKQPMQIIVTRTPSHPNPCYSPHVETMVNIVVNPEIIGQDRIEQNLVLDSVFRRDFRETVITKNLRAILDYCAEQGLCSVLFDLHRNSGDFEELLEEGLELGLFQKVVMEVLPFWDSSIRESSLQKLTKDLEQKRSLKLNKTPSRITKDSVVVEGYFD